jgi:NifB/MoaA-like Fe-S oxidoreductase
VRTWQRGYRRRLGTTFVFLADEFYLRAGVPLPGRAHYGDYPQIEDGVGMVRRFVIDAKKTLSRDRFPDFEIKPGSLRGTVATGELFYPILAPYIDGINEKWNTMLNLVAIRNQYFGPEVTVAGLIAGGDVLAARDSIEGDFLIVPEQACLKSGSVFLDDLTIEHLEGDLDIPVSHGGGSLQSLLVSALRMESQRPRASTANVQSSRV